MTRHTPAPWKYEDNFGCKEIKGGKRGTHKQARYTKIAWTEGLANEDEDKANARLIAAAPVLLQACKEALEYVDLIPGQPTRTAFESMLTAAIVKAEDNHG